MTDHALQKSYHHRCPDPDCERAITVVYHFCPWCGTEVRS